MAHIDSNLPPEVAAQYETVNWKGGWRLVFPAFSHVVPNGTVNLQLMTDKKAEALIQAGFPHLRKKVAKPEKAAKQSISQPTTTSEK